MPKAKETKTTAPAKKNKKAVEAPKVPVKAASKRIAKESSDKTSSKLDDGPQTPFNIFLKQMQAQMKSMAKFNTLNEKEKSKVIKDSWAKLTEGQKQQYVEMANADKARHERSGKKGKARPQSKDDEKKKRAPAQKEWSPVIVQPKKALTAFFFFLNQNRQKIIKENPDLKVTEVAKEGGTRWAAMSDAQKQPYIKLNEQDVKRHEKEVLQFQKEGFFINSDGVKSTELDKKGKVADFPQGTVMPKKAKISYMFFAAEYHSKNDSKGTVATETMKKIAELWNKLTDKQKQKYQAMNEKDKLRQEDQMNQLKTKGYFMTEDGTKSTELKYKPPKQRGKKQK